MPFETPVPQDDAFTRRQAAFDELRKLPGYDEEGPKPAEPEVVLEMHKRYMGNLAQITETDPERKRAAALKDTVEQINDWYQSTQRTLEPTTAEEVREALEKYFKIEV